ncbi:hypothetical protein N9B94_01755 [Verrucomicrobia bacterium]|nr:hypothetical protein [Verrucomicrobiota bacterium]
MVKPINLGAPYHSASCGIDSDDHEARISLNQLTDQLLDGHYEYSYSRHQMTYVGNLDTRTWRRFIGWEGGG